MFSNGNYKKQKGKSIMRIPKKFLVLLCTVALIVSLMPMSALAATAYNSSVVSNTIPATLTPGQVAYAKITVKNTGANTWTAARGIQLKETDSLKLLPYAYKLAKTDSIKKNQTKTFTVKITAPATAGTYNLSLQMYRNGTKFGAAITKAIVVKSAVKTLSSIAVTKQPTKTSYIVGESLDLAGLEVTGTYTDGSKAPVVVTVNNVTGYDPNKTGEQTLTITSSGKTATFKVTVKLVGVDSIALVNGKEVVINFNKALKPSTIITTGKLAAGVLSFTSINGAPAITTAGANGANASLSADGKTLTIVPVGATGTEYFGGDYAITITPDVQDKDGKAITAYSNVHTLKDSVRPTVASITYKVNGKARITFSEPINITAAALQAQMSITNASGSFVTVPAVTSVDSKTFELNVSTFTAGQNYTVSIIGVSDFAGNLITPNPNTFTVTNTVVDNIKPYVVKVEPLGTGSARITFSEPLSAYGTINTVPINLAAGGNASKDSTGTVITVTGIAALTGTVAVTIDTFADEAGNTNAAAFTGYYNFVADNIKPTYVSSSTITIGTTQYLLVKYSENVKVVAGHAVLGSGSYVDADQITHGYAGLAAGAATVYTPNSEAINDTIKIDLTGLVAGTYTVPVLAGLVTDYATPVNPTDVDATVTFTVGAAAPDTTVPKATIAFVQDTVEAKSNDVIIVTFDKEMSASALVVANYTIEDQQVFQSAIFDGTKKRVKLTLIPGIYTVSGNRTISVKNVASVAGVKIADTSAIKLVKENVKPVFASVSMTGLKEITAKFSEAVTSVTPDMFEVYIDGVKVAAGVTAEAPTNTDSVKIAVPANIDLSKKYTVKFIGTDFIDQASVVYGGAPNYVPSNVTKALN